MGARFADIVIDTTDAWALADWWASVLEDPVAERNVEDDGMRWATIKPTDSLRTIVFLDVPEPKAAKNRVHIDLRPNGVDQATELQRLLGLGAKQVDIGQGDQTWVVLADPEGNEFCLLRGRFDDPDVD